MSKRDREPFKALREVAGRLIQMRQHWDDASKYYFDPDRFLLSLQSCIIVSRTVTFILQSNKSEIEGFDDWYESHRAKWADDSIMKWARDARNKIEKQGDLTTHSQIRMAIIAGYLDGPETNWVPQALFRTPTQILRSVPSKYLNAHTIAHGTLLIERRWVENELPDAEVLEALGHVYRELSDMVVDLCRHLQLVAPTWLPAVSTEMMDVLAMDRAIYLSMSDGSVSGFRYFQKNLIVPNKRAVKAIAKRYGKSANWGNLIDAHSLREVAIVFFEKARILMARDGYHRSLLFFLKGPQIIKTIDAPLPDRASKYVVMRDLAKLARIDGADGVMMIGEAWTARGSDIPKSGFAEEATKRGEALVMHVANNKGEMINLSASVIRRKKLGSKKVKRLGVTEITEDIAFVLAPFLSEWGCLDMDKVVRATEQLDALGIETP